MSNPNRYAVVLTVEGKFILEVKASSKMEALDKIDAFALEQDLAVTEQGEILPVRSSK